MVQVLAVIQVLLSIALIGLILMLTGSNSRADVDRARRAGAAGYVTKDRIAAELIEAIVEIATR
jgi:DNA-binding NarL/FixJ family response regulator